MLVALVVKPMKMIVKPMKKNKILNKFIFFIKLIKWHLAIKQSQIDFNQSQKFFLELN